MKKLFWVSIAVVLSFGLLLSAIGFGSSSSDSSSSGSNTGASASSSGSSNSNSVVGSWKDNADVNTIMIYTADGKVTVNSLDAGTYSVSGNELVITAPTGTKTTYEMKFDGNNLTLTDKATNQLMSLTKSS